MVSVLADPALYAHIGGNPPSLAELRGRFARQVRGGGWFNWMLRVRADDRLVGFVQATCKENQADLAWLLAPSAQGFGFATEAATVAVDWLTTDGVTTLIAYIHPDNLASAAVARRLGLTATDIVKGGETQWRATRGA